MIVSLHTTVPGADVWQICLVKVIDEIFWYFMSCLHFLNISLKVKVGLVLQWLGNALAIGILVAVVILHGILLPIVSNRYTTWRDQSICNLLCWSFSTSNDLSLATITH